MQDDQTQQLNKLKTLLGAELLSFILNADAVSLETPKLDKRQIQAFEKIIPAIDLFSGQNEFERPLNIAQSLCSYVDNLGTSWATYLHYFCSGSRLPDLSHIKDSAERSLMIVARDTYPSLLIKRDRFGAPSMFASSYTHPSGRQFNADIFRANNPIRKLFPNSQTYRYYKNNPEAAFSVRRNVILSNGHGGTVSAAMILESLLTSSVFSQDDTSDSLLLYCQGVQRNYRRLRKNIGRKILKISTIIGLSNVDLQNGSSPFRISKNIIIRQPTLIDRLAMFEDSSEPTMIVEIENDISILDNYLMSEESPRDPFARYKNHDHTINQFYLKHQSDLNKVRLAMLLSSDQTFIAPGYVFSTALNPISLNRNSSTSPYRWPSVRYEKQTISRAKAKQIRQWLAKLNYLPDTLEVSIKRLISATTERLDDADAFIDAVMVWENLFGAKQETTFRISAALSTLIEPSSKVRRKRLLGEIKTLYEKRSRLVHGTPNVDISKIEYEKTRAIEIAISALRIVVSSKRLLLASSSESRGSIVLLGFSPETK